MYFDIAKVEKAKNRFIVLFNSMPNAFHNSSINRDILMDTVSTLPN